MGTTAKSCSIRDVIESLIVQIWTVFQIPLGHGNDMLKDLHFSVLCEFFANLIWSLREYKGKVLIVLDAVDQLRSDDNPYNMQWLPRFLPPNVHLFVSIIPDMFDLLENCEKILPPHPMCYCKIEGMGMDSACTFLQAYGVLAQRTLTPQQTNVILDNFAQCRVPMFLKLAFERAKDWKSFTRLEHIKLGKNVKELIVNLFDSLSVSSAF